MVKIMHKWIPMQFFYKDKNNLRHVYANIVDYLTKIFTTSFNVVPKMPNAFDKEHFSKHLMNWLH
jgi:hypothetical protein